MTFKVLTAEFLHESNTFNMHKTGLSSFEARKRYAVLPTFVMPYQELLSY